MSRQTKNESLQETSPKINFKWLTQAFIWLVLAAVVFSLALPPLISVFGQSKDYSIDGLDVKIQVNEDSTMEVTEKITYTFNDEMNGMFREIGLTNEDNLNRCRQNPELQCGGFDWVVITGVKVNEGDIAKDRYQTETIEDGSEKRLRVQYEFDDAPVLLRNQTYTFEVKYLVYGGIGFFEDYDLFYWNAVFPDRDKIIKQTKVTISYPGKVSTTQENLSVFGVDRFSYNQAFENNSTGSKLIFNISNLNPGQNFTVAQKIPKGQISEPFKVIFDLEPQTQTLKIPTENLNFEVANEQKLSLPSDTSLEAEFEGGFMYQPQTQKIFGEAGQTKTVTSKLEYTTLGWIIFVATMVLNVILFLATFVIPFIIWQHWHRTGRDQGTRSTVAVEYNPPKGIKSYMAGLLIDEEVHNKDISSTIIDLAYKRYLTIDELPKGFLGSQDYLFKKTGENQIKKAALDKTEEKVLEMIFGRKNQETKLSELKAKAYTKLENIRSKIYAQAVSDGYFLKNPHKTRQSWYTAGIVTFVLGGVVGFFTIFIGVITLILATTVSGIAMILFARSMPAKTLKGGQALMDLKGFRMYMETAEKDRMQNLTPEMFEEYLPFAIIFGLEKQWAQKFKDIATGNPDWYNSQNSTFDTLLFASALSNFTTSTNSVISSAPSSGGSGFGSGGGFSGGFSGGGGGGGGGGAW